MTYLDRQAVVIGDMVEIKNYHRNHVVVVEIIEPNSRQAIEWNSLKGGLMTQPLG